MASEWDAAGHPPLRILSVDRSFRQQEELYRNRGRPGWPSVVAPPGTSGHEFGAAVDVQVPPGYRRKLHRTARKHGLTPLSGQLGRDDPGHLELPRSLWRPARRP